MSDAVAGTAGRTALLLRAVNVGGRKVPMVRLRECLSALGYTDVQTYLQSGNAVFGAAGATATDVVSRVEPALRDAFGIDIPVVVRSAPDLDAVVAGNPYRAEAEDPTKVVALFLRDEVPPAAAAAFDLSDLPERGSLGDRVVYLHYPHGQGRSRLTPAMLERRLGGQWGTARNWRTVLALQHLAHG